MRVIWLPSAEDSLNCIYDYIKTESENSAINVYNSILDEVDRLSKFPRIGKANSLLVGIRTLVVLKNYKAVYYIDGDIVYIVMVWDCRRNPEEFRQSIIKYLK
ncbi:MAG: type II toxin-antitoxin system RelE/ParE family toxin [Prevotella sp.]|nr:type II toxin-antitoxin system RelE/ParE family toxin [Prevotella sp.]